MTIDPVSLAITAALTAASMAMNASRKIEGPRLDDLSVTLADYGAPLNYFYGTRRFEGAQIIWAEPITETKRRRKTKGGKFNEYVYTGTWAIVVADQPIDAVTRIWFDKHLVYDATGAGPMTPLGSGAAADDETSAIDLSSHIRIYLGTDDQEPDPRMLATVEAEHGAGSCPAYRRISYIVIEDVPLEKFGNRIPQQSVEATSNGVDAFPYEVFDTATSGAGLADLSGFAYSPDGSRFTLVDWDTNEFETWDVAARSLMISGTFSNVGSGDQQIVGVSNDGKIYIDGGGEFAIYSPDGLSAEGTISVGGSIGFVQVIGTSDGEEYVCGTPQSPFSTEVFWFFHIGGLIGSDAIEVETPGWDVTSFAADDADNVWAIGGTGTTCHFLCIAGPRSGEENTFTTISGNAFAVHNGAGAWVVAKAHAHLYLVDDETFAIIDDTAFTMDQFAYQNQFMNCPVGATSIYLSNPSTDDMRQVSTADLSVIRTIDPDDWADGKDTNAQIYDPVNHAIISFPSTDDNVSWLYLDRVSGDGVTLQEIVEDVASRCGVDASDIDATDLDQTIAGYSWTQGTGKDIISPLLDAHDSDARPHNFGLEFLKRGSSAAATISVGEMVRKGDEDRYRVTMAQDTDLPRILTLSFADPAGDQQTNSVVVRRDGEATDSARELSINLTTLVLSVDEARQLAERYFRRQWNARYKYELSLTPQRLAIEPADVYTLGLDSISHTARNTKLTITGKENVLRTEWERDAPILATLTSNVGATFDGRRDQSVLVPQISKGFVLDIPLIRDADNDSNPILYFGAGPYSEGGTWPGATFYQSSDGTEYDLEFGSIASTMGLTWGYANGTLANATASVWDRGNTVSVTVKNGELTSVTEADIDANPTLNLAVLGEELLNFTTATLVSDTDAGRVYTLSGFKRGRRGTEGFTSGHATSDRFILLDAVGNEEMGASDIGDTLYFKASTDGRDPASAFPIVVDPYEANSNKPYAPAWFEGHRTASGGDWVFTWNRRSRIGGRWTGGTTVPLGESAENYEVDIMNGASVVRTITATSETATWTTANQTSDFGSAQATVTARVRQIGDLVDGRNATATF